MVVLHSGHPAFISGILRERISFNFSSDTVTGRRPHLWNRLGSIYPSEEKSPAEGNPRSHTHGFLPLRQPPHTGAWPSLRPPPALRLVVSSRQATPAPWFRHLRHASGTFSLFSLRQAMKPRFLQISWPPYCYSACYLFFPSLSTIHRLLSPSQLHFLTSYLVSLLILSIFSHYG